jgi:hypothetical protein
MEFLVLRYLGNDPLRLDIVSTELVENFDKKLAVYFLKVNYLSVYGSTALVDLGRFFSFLI